jgi:hypothetical protein
MVCGMIFQKKYSEIEGIANGRVRALPRALWRSRKPDLGRVREPHFAFEPGDDRPKGGSLV